MLVDADEVVLLSESPDEEVVDVATLECEDDVLDDELVFALLVAPVVVCVTEIVVEDDD